MKTDEERKLDEIFRDVPEEEMRLTDADIEELYKMFLKEIKRRLENERY